MRRPRPPLARRRAHRSVQLVDGDLTPKRRPSPLGPEAATVYEHSLARVRDMRRLFPNFYAEHISWRQLTPRALYAAVGAFLSLVTTQLFALDDCLVFDIPLDPLQNLAYTEDDAIAKREPLLELEEALSYIAQPHAALYGIGVEGILEDETPQSALTLALWKLCQHTDWAIGVDVAHVIGFSYLPESTIAIIKKLHPLSAEARMDAVTAAAALSGGPWPSRVGELICYAFARTGNPMADTTNYELEVVYGGDLDDTWNDALSIAENAREARELAQLYHRWAAAVDDAPHRELKKLEKALHDAAIASVAPPPSTLIDILVEHDPAFAEVEP